MTKAKQAVTESLEVLDTITDDEQRDYWARDNALSHALALHRINGGMKPVHQVMADAMEILKFLKGNNDE